MYVYVLNKEDKPLMPTNPAKARLLLKNNKAKVVRRTPFTIKLTHDSTSYTQSIVAGMDTGSKVIGCAALSSNKVLYQSEVTLRQDVSSKMQERAMYRRTRRNRKLRYRPARFNNRKNSKKEGRIPPSIKSKIDSHIREKNFVESILPISKWIVETASFDIHKITNPEVSGKEYQEGKQLSFYNTKAYILFRDNYTCQNCKGASKDIQLHVHHIIFKSKCGTDEPSNLITLCKTCHDSLHNGDFTISVKKSRTKHATQVSIIKSQLKNCWNFTETFGYETKFKRESLSLPKTHYNDAIAICYNKDKLIYNNTLYLKRHVNQGDYQQTTGKHSQKNIPTGKLFGLRKFDLIKTTKGIGIVKGKRSTGYFSISDIFGNSITDSINIKKNCKRLSARTSTLIQIQEVTAFPLLS